MEEMILHVLLLEQQTDNIEDVFLCRYDEVILPVLGAAFFERGWAHPAYPHTQPIDTLALGDIGYVTQVGNFVVVDNVHACRQDLGHSPGMGGQNSIVGRNLTTFLQRI